MSRSVLVIVDPPEIRCGLDCPGGTRPSLRVLLCIGKVVDQIVVVVLDVVYPI